MAAENDVRKLGRVEYIEPNNLFINSIGNKVQNGIPQPYEDYSFSVNLRVINGDRYACGMTGEGGDLANDFLEFSSDNGTISFMDGTSVGGQGYLTTNFTDISMNNPETNTKECLGIESISIKYDSWYYPTVDMKFIDVRGASLMQPAEYEYYNNGNPNPVQGKNKAASNSDFFKAFFSFPYPLFKLSVKGFYGKEVTYDLSVLKCNVSFNSSTGNFEVNASFIGYMYGLYGDLPFPFIYLAPYIQLYGADTWDEKRSTGDFCYIDEKDKPAKTMYTFPELRFEVQNAGEKADKELAITPKGKRKIELGKLTNELDQKVIFHYPMTSRNYSWWSWTSSEEDNKREGFYYLPVADSAENNRKIFENFLTFATNLNDYNISAGTSEYYKSEVLMTKDIFNDFYSDAENIRKSKKQTQAEGQSAATISSVYTDEEIKTMLEKHMAVLAFHKDDTDKEKPVLVFDASKSSFGKRGQSEFTPLVEELLKRFKNNDANSPMHKSMAQKEWTIRAFFFNNLNYKADIVEQNNKLKKELDALTVELDKERDQKITKSIGFDPTIKNMYNMVFAHIDTFMSCFYNTLDRIRQSIQSSTDDSRKYTKLCGGGSKIEVDVNDNALKSESSNGGKLPPFTMFYKEETVKNSEDKKMVMMWPGELEGGDKLDEVKLVEAIIDATSLNRRSFEPVTPKDNVIDREGDLVPINYYDIVRGKGNPYLDVLNEKNLQDEKIARLVMDIFMYRCFYSMLGGSYVANSPGESNDTSTSSVANFTKKAKLIAELEVGNVERAFQMLNMKPTKAFLQGLNKLPDMGNLLLNSYIGGYSPTLKAKGANGELSYDLISKYDGDSFLYNCLPVGTFVPSTLQNYANGANLKKDVDKFLKINSSGTVINGTYACHLYSGGKKLERSLTKYTSGDFSNATRLFPNYETLPKSISGLTFGDGAFKNKTGLSIKEELELAKKLEENGWVYNSNTNQYEMDPITAQMIKRATERLGAKREIGIQSLYAGNSNASISLPSFRKTDAGITNIFMDPLYYAQTSREARAYLFLMGVPFGKDKKYFLPETVENGDYPTLLLLREGAYYWRNQGIYTMGDEGAPIVVFGNDPITYEYTINGALVNTLEDIEKNDPCLGRRVALEFYKNSPKNVSIGRKQMLMDYFLKWVDGVAPDKNPDAVIPTVTADSYVHVEVPSPAVYFQTIEQNLALWENAGETKQLLTPESCSSAITVELAGTFANATALKTFYFVGTDGRLGTINEKIRTNVLMRENLSTSGIVPFEFFEFYRSFSQFYTGFDTIIDFSCLDNPNANYTVPKNALSDALSAFVKGLKDANKISIEKIKEGNGVDSSGRPEDKEPKNEYFRSKDLKLACYIALKSMYDRWLCNRRRECWSFSCIPSRMNARPVKSDFLRFFYIDEFYHDSSMKVRPNLTNFIENACKLGGFTEKSNDENLASTSVIKILSSTAQYGRCSLLTLPTMLGLAKTYTDENNSIADVFRAYPYNEAVRSNNIETSFIVLSTSQKSAVLNVPDDKGKMGYKSDGFDIANTWGEIVEQPFFSDATGDGFVVPSFGVTFAKQNQSFFKDVRLSMEDHQVTEYSVRNEVMISYQSNRGPRETSMVGQDLYSVYSNYSYSCSVSMMGDAQITPLMYFQLNNIPMWKGAYLITNVHHEISTRGMETVFTGVRQARPSTPFKGDDMEIPANSAAKQTAQSQDETHPAPEQDDTLNESPRELDKIDVTKAKSIIFILDRTSLRTSNKWVNGFLSVRVLLEDGRTENHNDIAQTIEAVYGLSNEMFNNIGTNNHKIENLPPNDNTVLFCLPAGRLSTVIVENPFEGEEYRDKNDTFYKFTDGKHMTVSDMRLGYKRCEMITGETNYDKFENGGFSEISLGGIAPIMIYPPVDPDMNKQLDKNEIRATYKEIFNLIKRAREAKKPVTFLINESTDIKENKS